MLLTDTAIRNAMPDERLQKLFDGDGLYLLIKPSGAKLWRFKYRVRGREKLLSFGAYPEVSLQAARGLRHEARTAVAAGVDPSAHRKAQRVQEAHTFGAVAKEWLDIQKSHLDARTYIKKKQRLEAFLLPKLACRPLVEIKAPDILAVLRIIEKRGKHETAHRVRSECGAIFRFAAASGRVDGDPTALLRHALAPVKRRHRPALTDLARVGDLLRAIDGYRGRHETEIALKLLPLTFVRPGELRRAEWSEIDLERAEWRIPAHRMKMREQHVVPLSRQAVALLKELQWTSSDRRLVFPSVRHDSRPISDNTLNAALRQLGFSGQEMVAHGFRSIASTCLNEQGWHPDLIELQLAHAERNEVRGAYNKAQRLRERRDMMQVWADYLDQLRDKSKAGDKKPTEAASNPHSVLEEI